MKETKSRTQAFFRQEFVADTGGVEALQQQVGQKVNA